MIRRDAEVIVVGGGPVGSLLALSLLAEGVDVRVVEGDPSPRRGSRSIGVHPPSIELMAELRLAERLLARGVLVRRGRAFGENGPLGVVDFSACPGPHRYVLAVPQVETEGVLRAALEERAPGALELGVFTSLEQDEAGVLVGFHGEAGPFVRRASVVVGCDGKRSAVRSALGIAFEGAPYPGRYAMADFPDETSLGDDAAIYLGRGGLVESFPLPNRSRRWVARCDEDRGPRPAEVGPNATGRAGAGLDALVDRVARRCGTRLDASRGMGASVFRAERWAAGSLAAGRVALAGDAAHVVSPIGGQGMNLGWLGARSLAQDLSEALRRGRPVARALESNGRERARVARAAARRAELNMWLGRPGTVPWARDLLLRGLLRRPLVGILSRVFTMRGLGLGV